MQKYYRKSIWVTCCHQIDCSCVKPRPVFCWVITQVEDDRIRNWILWLLPSETHFQYTLLVRSFERPLLINWADNKINNGEAELIWGRQCHLSRRHLSLCISHTSDNLMKLRTILQLILQASITIHNNSQTEWVWKVKKVTENRYNWPGFLLHRVKSSYTHFDKDPEGLYINQIVDKWSKLQISSADMT